MPYLRCASCGVLSYTSLDASGGHCPACGVPVPSTVATRPSGAEDSDRRLDARLRMTRELLDTDLVLLTEIRDGQEIIMRAAGGWPELGPVDAVSWPLSQTFCQRMLDGRIGNYVRDAATDTRVSDLSLVSEGGVRSWIGVPIRVSETRLYVLCCLARASQPSLGDREVRLLTGLAESVRAELV